MYVAPDSVIINENTTKAYYYYYYYYYYDYYSPQLVTDYRRILILN